MTELEFKRLAAEGFNRVPLVLETFADLDTPLSVYLKLAGKPYSYLLESVQGGERFGRYSFIGLPAQTRIVVRSTRSRCSTARPSPRRSRRRTRSNSFAAISSATAQRRCRGSRASPAVWWGSSATRPFATSSRSSPDARRSPIPIGTPDIVLLQSEEIAIVDNLAGKLYLVVYADPRNPLAYAHGKDRLRELLAALREPVAIPAARADGRARAAVRLRRGELPAGGGEVEASTSSTATSCRCRSRSGCRAGSPPRRSRCIGACAR